MSDVEYCKMLEIPVQSCDIIVKPTRRRKKDVVNKVIEKVNLEEEKSVKKKEKRKFAMPKFSKMRKKTKKEVIATSTNEARSKKFDIVSVQVVAIFALIVGIVLTNIFWENSGMNNLLKQVFNSNQEGNSAVYTSFTAVSPSKSQNVLLEEGVLKVASGSIYSPCDGVVDSIEESDGVYTITIRHSDSFTSVINGAELCYMQIGDKVYSNIPVGYSSNEMSVCMFNNDAILTSFTLDGNNIVWIN